MSAPDANRTVRLQPRSAYGVRRIYPVNLTARLLAGLTGKATLSEADVALIQKIGFEIEWIPESAGKVEEL